MNDREFQSRLKQVFTVLGEKTIYDIIQDDIHYQEDLEKESQAEEDFLKIRHSLTEDYSMLAFNVESFDLDENRNGTINILYLPSNAGDGATKVNLTIVKNGDTYKIEYAMLSGLYEVDLSSVSTEYTEFVIQE